MENYAAKQRIPQRRSRRSRKRTCNRRYANFAYIVSSPFTVALLKYVTDCRICWVLGFILGGGHFDPPLAHLPGSVWSHTVAFPRVTGYNQWREGYRTAGTVITVSAGVTMVCDSEQEGGGSHLTPSVFSCGVPSRTYSQAPVADRQFDHFTFTIFSSTSPFEKWLRCRGQRMSSA